MVKFKFSGIPVTGEGKTMKTKCVWKRDEWGNDHDMLQYDFSDIATIVTKASLNPRGAVTKIILTKDGRIIWYTKEFRQPLSFCEERRVEELDEKYLSELCDLIRRGDTVTDFSRISVSVYDRDLISSVCT